jgi:hypothetical protein
VLIHVRDGCSLDFSTAPFAIAGARSNPPPYGRELTGFVVWLDQLQMRGHWRLPRQFAAILSRLLLIGRTRGRGQAVEFRSSIEPDLG